MASIMVDVYVKLVLAGKRSIEEVPEQLREEVRMIVGGDENGIEV